MKISPGITLFSTNEWRVNPQRKQELLVKKFANVKMTTMRGELDALRGHLTPWRECLRQLALVEPVSRYAPPSEETVPDVLWMQSTNDDLLSDESPLPFQRLCEGLCLLALLADISAEAWEHEVMEIWPGRDMLCWVEDQRALSDQKRRRQYAIGLHVDQVVQLTRGNLTGNCIDTSAEYTRVSTILKAAVRDDKEILPNHRPTTRIPIRVELECFQRECDEVKTFVMMAVYLVMKQDELHKQQPRPGAMDARQKPHLFVEEVFFDSTTDARIDVETIELLQRINERGVRVMHFPEIGDDKENQRHLVVGGLRSLLAVPDCTPSTPYAHGVHTVVVIDHVSGHLTTAVLSAIQHSASARALSIQIGNDNSDDESDEDSDDDDDDTRSIHRSEQTKAWQWIAYTIFSRHANHSITSLDLELEHLKDEDVQGVQDVLAADDPRSFLYSNGRDHCLPDFIAATQFCLENPAYTSLGPVKSYRAPSETYPITVRVIDAPQNDSDNWWKVILPGGGEAYVHQDNALRASAPADQVERNGQPEIPTIEISRLPDDSYDKVVSLLGSIAQGTRVLYLREPPIFIRRTIDQLCGRFLDVCPSLEELYVRLSYVHSLQPFVACALAGTCRLRHLALKYVYPKKMTHIRGFFQALCDPSHPLTVHLRVLCLSFEIKRRELDELVKLLVQVLEHNRSLLEINIEVKGIETDDDYPVDRDSINELFTEHSKETLSIRTEAFEIEKKLAFLSVAMTNQRNGDGCVVASGVNALDSNVISTIFQFAAPSRTRKFRFQFV